MLHRPLPYVSRRYTSAQSTTIASVGAPYVVNVSPDGRTVCVLNFSANTATLIDVATATTRTVATGTQPQCAVFSPDSSTVYVANNVGNNVTVITVSTGATATVTCGTAPLAIAINDDGSLVFVANSGSNNVTRIVTSSHATTNIAVTPNPVNLHTAQGKLYISVGHVTTSSPPYPVNVLDMSTSVLTTLATGSTAAQSDAVPTPDGSLVFVGLPTTTQISRIVTGTGATTLIDIGIAPGNLIMQPDGKAVYSINATNLTRIDTATGTPTTVANGTAPFAGAMSPDGTVLLVAEFANNDVLRIDTGTQAVTTFAVGAGPNGIAFLPLGNRAYVPNSGADTVSVINALSSAA